MTSDRPVAPDRRDLAPDRRSVERELTGSGGEFEVVVENVLGHPVRAYRSRHRSLREMLAKAFGRGGGLHVVHGSDRLGFGDMLGSAASIAAGLRAAGIRPGDRVAVLAANSPEWIATFWGTVASGGVLVGLNGWWSADEVAYGIRDCGARILVADQARYQRVKDRLAECPELREVYLVGEHTPGTVPFEELRAHPMDALPEVPIEEDDPAVILYTSGTTGRPRGAVHTHRGVIANAQNMRFSAAVAARLAGLTAPATPTSLVTVPFFHVSGCHAGFVAAMDRGSTVVLATGRFDPEQVLELIERECITQWSTVPTMVQGVIDHVPARPYDVSSLAAVGYGGSPSGAGLQRRARATFPGLRGIHIGYGLTETCGAVTINGGDELDRAPEAAGRALPIVELRVGPPPLREEGSSEPEGPSSQPEGPSSQPEGGAGEVQVRSSQSMAGYWPLGSATSIDQDGWLSTGDIGYLDADQVLHLTDRAKDMIIRGGENVYCAEIENRLTEHPAIAEAAVIGIPHASLGEEVGVVVSPRPGAQVAAYEVRDWVGATLARFKVPAHVWISDSPLPRNATGKVLKAQLRDAQLAGGNSAGEHVR